MKIFMKKIDELQNDLFFGGDCHPVNKCMTCNIYGVIVDE